MGVSAATLIGMLGSNTMPVFVGALMEGLDLDAAAVGGLASLELAAVAATSLEAATGTISFNELGEVKKAVQVQQVKDGAWHHHSVIDDPELLAPPSK